MIEVRAVSKSEDTHVTVNVDGEILDLANETLAIITELMNSIRKHSLVAHAAIINELAHDPSILFGEDFTRGMRKGVN